MTDTASAEEPAHPLRRALRRARLEAAEHSQAVADLRTAALARLDLLRERLHPVFRDLPRHADLFDPSLVPGDPPRLFVDLVAFVDMARDGRTYRLVRDTHAGRQVLAEEIDVGRIAGAVTDYVARRLVERERLLAGAAPTTGDRARRAEPPAEPNGGRRMATALAFAAGLLIGAGAGFFAWH